MLPRVEEILKKNDRFYQLDKGLRVFQEIHTGWQASVKSIESGLATIQSEPAFAAFRRLYTGPVTDAGLELIKAADLMIGELQTIHERPSLAEEELKDEAKDDGATIPMTKTA